jgi:ABC-type antimicrobial peptide transport system permease subunit
MKSLLFAKSNIKKNKGLNIGITLLMIISTLLLTMSFMMMFDVAKNVENTSKKLNASDGYLVIHNDLTDINDELINNNLKDYTTKYYIDSCVASQFNFEFNNSEMSLFTVLFKTDKMNSDYDKTEIVEENKDITSNFIYLPYQFKIVGGFKLNDTFKLGVKQTNSNYQFTIKGFINNTFGSCNSSGGYTFFLDDDNYNTIYNSNSQLQGLYINYYLKENVYARSILIKLQNACLSVNDMTNIEGLVYADVIQIRQFMALIISVAFIVLSSILILVIALMLGHSISNFIKENMKKIGALKAIGYTSFDIRKSLLLQFLIVSLIGTILGVAIGYFVMPILNSLAESQSGCPYTVKFNLMVTILPFIIMITFTMLIVYLLSRKIKFIDPEKALREGIDNHNFKKNFFPLSKSRLNLNLNLTFKTLFYNMKQNLTTFFVVGIMMFASTMGLLMYENFNRHLDYSILTTEICSGFVCVDESIKEEAKEIITKNGGTNIRDMYQADMYYKEEDSLLVNITDDFDKLNNKSVCYEGRFPKYDNEIAISGKFAKDFGYTVGKTVPITLGDMTCEYLITGLIQTVNNRGREAFMSNDAAKRLNCYNMNPYYWFDGTDLDSTNVVFEELTNTYPDKVYGSINFFEQFESQTGVFKSIAKIMLIVTFGISICVIMLVLFLLIQSLIFKKKKEFGILKAVGYRSRDLIFEASLSFMPSIILSVIVFGFISFKLANPYMSLMMFSFGLVKPNFTIPLDGMVIISICLILISFLATLFNMRKIKYIEPYEMLLNE